MEMNYLNNYQKDKVATLEKYKKVIEEYNEVTSSADYFKCTTEFPYKILNAIYLCENLKLFQNTLRKPQMFFSTPEKAIIFYKELIALKKEKEDLLSSAYYIKKVEECAVKINEIRSKPPYFLDIQAVYADEELLNLANTALEIIPEYEQMMTKDFRYNFIESLITIFSEEEIQKFFDAGVIKEKDLQYLSENKPNNQSYNQKISNLLAKYNVENYIDSYQIKLKGVTFENEDGTKRQDNLKRLETFLVNNPGKVPLTAEKYIFTHQDTGISKPAIRIKWNNLTLGNVEEPLAVECEEKFDNPRFTAELVRLSGGGKVSLGCIIKLNIIGKYKEKQPELVK